MNYRRGEFIRDERRPFSLLPSSYYARVTTKSNTKRELRIGFDRSFEFDHAFNLFTDGYFEDEKLISGLSIVEGASLTYRSATTGGTIIDKKSFDKNRIKVSTDLDQSPWSPRANARKERRLRAPLVTISSDK